MQSNFIVESLRGDVQEKRFYGWIILVDKNKNILQSLPLSDYTCYMRSCEKPIQALCAYELGAIEKFQITDEELAISYSSHSGSSRHVSLLKGILKKLDITEDKLLCGIHPPIDKQERHRLIKEGLKPTTLHNNCSGKHIFIIASCLAKGWPINNYTDLNHPVQKYISKLVDYYCSPEQLTIGIDGCSMPIHAMKLTEMGAGFAKYFDGTTPYAEKLANAITNYPELAGGIGRVDSAIIEVSEGKLLAKVGAEGLMIVTKRHSGQAVVIKMASGDDYMRNIVTIEVLKKMKWLHFNTETFHIIEPFAEYNIYNHAGKQIGSHKIYLNDFLVV